MISHGFVEFQNNESTERIISYNGGELQLDYFVYAEGIAKNCGFLIYIDGVPQPYKIKELNEDYQYLHTLALEEGEEFEFSFLFIPVTGKKDDILSISIVSIIDPLFMPDMEETTSYGYRHGILEASYQIKFEQDTEEILEQDLIQHSVLKDITVSNVPMTDIDQENFKSGFKIEDSLSDDKVYTRLYIDNKDMKLESSYDISNKNNIRLRFEMTGFPGLKYKNTLYFNHKPICELRNNFFEFDLQKGFKWVLDAELDVTMLEEKGSFYIVSVPVNKGNFPNSPVSVFKTRTIFFYDSSKLNIEYENEGAKIRSARQDKTNPNLGGIDPSSVDEIYYVGDDKLCILSDKFYFYSIEDDSLLASLERNPDASYFDIRKIDNGYVIIGETGAPYKDDVYNFETGQRELIDAFHLGCTFYNENLVEIETVDIIKEIELDLIHHPAHIAVSGDGDLIACISNNNLYVYDRIRKKITLIFDQLSIADSAVNEIIFTNISFVNNNKIIFLAHCSDENNQVYPAYGMVNADGSDFYLHRGAAFDKLVSYDDFSIMSQKDSLVGLIGEVWSFYHSKNKTVKLCSGILKL